MAVDLELSEALTKYRGMEAGTIAPIQSGTANKNYLIECNGQRFVIRKRNLKYSSDLWIQYETEYLHHLSSKGIQVSVPLKTNEGNYYCKLGDSVYQVYTYIEGSSFEVGRLEEVSESGAFLGRLHTALSDFQPLHEKILPRYDSPSESVEVIDRHLQKHSLTLEMDEKKKLDYIRNQARLVLDYIPDEAYHELPKVVIHGDYHPANVKGRNGKICGLFDFDWISSQPRLRDIIDGLIYFSSIRSKGIDGGDIFSLTNGYHLDLGRSKAFIAAYSESGVNPLTQREVDCIPYLIRARLIYSRIQALPKIPEDRAIEMLTRGLEEPLLWLDQNQEQMEAAFMPYTKKA